MASEGAHRNRLAAETSPYLLQHAHNPVDWYPWGPEALDRARRKSRPILLSIGYSACHWCHVMAHESFEDEATAAVMNAHFVNVKVDREERPDLDKIYQVAHQLLARRPGGWPLTMFLTPDDQTPFFGGTYFPPSPRHGLPAFRDLLLRVVDFLAAHGDEVAKQNESLRTALARTEPSGAAVGTAGAGAAVIGPEPLERAMAVLRRSFDARDGGFGGAPKFPHPTNVERCFRRRRDPRDLHMGVHTLARMCLGGIYDHLGGGFCRYSVDGEWMIPHFEKMLYDNGPLLALCAQGVQLRAGHEALFARTAHETARWAIREMQAPEGGFHSALDADSEGEEGRFYLWTPDAARAVLDEDELAALAVSFGLDRPPNFEGHAWHLHTFVEREALPAKLGADAETAAARLDRARAKLFEARAPRVRPGLDDKILTSWNAMMVSGLAVAGKSSMSPASSARRSGRSTSSAGTHGSRAGSMPPGRTAAPASPPIWTTTPSSSKPPCGSSKPAGGRPISTSRSRSRKRSSNASRTGNGAASGSPPMITSGSCTAASRSRTTPCRPETGSPRSGSGGSATCSGRPATWRRPNAPSPPRGRASWRCRTRTGRC